MGGVDISDAFYNIELPKELRTFFALDPVRARDIGIKSCEGQAVKGSDFVFPGFKVHPMDWTHALWVCQRCHEILVDEPPNIRASLRVTHRRPVGTLSMLILLFRLLKSQGSLLS